MQYFTQNTIFKNKMIHNFLILFNTDTNRKFYIILSNKIKVINIIMTFI